MRSSRSAVLMATLKFYARLGVAEYQLVRALPNPLDTSLPSIEEIEAELSRELGDRSGPTPT